MYFIEEIPGQALPLSTYLSTDLSIYLYVCVYIERERVRKGTYLI